MRKMRNINLLHLLIFLCSVVPAALSLRCLKDEKTVLLELKSELIFDSSYSTKLLKWNESADNDCCGWDGVKCNDAGRVTALKLGGESISGGLNESSSLLRLRHLEELDLSGNALSGSIPDTIFALPSLQILFLNGNKFNNIDHHHFPSVSLSSNLVSVDLSYNSLSGSLNIPLSFFGTMPSLSVLVLSSNQFSGEINEFGNFSFFSNLYSLFLNNNLLSGSIPHSFFALPSLATLVLSYNQFSGQVGELFMNTANIVYLYLDNNRLEGPILSHNLFVNGTTFQPENNLITILDLSYNNLQSVDATIANFIISHAFPNLRELSLASCNLTSFPNFLKQTTVETLDLSNNQIAGDIPSWIWETGLIELNLSFNSLQNLQKPYLHLLTTSDIKSLDLHSNQLRGELPPLPHKAFYIDYSSNYIHGTVPSSFFDNISDPYMNLFSLANNRISGPISTSFCSVTFASVLDLSFNNLSGTIPPCFVEEIWDLVVLNLRGNNITGVLPDRFPDSCDLKTLDLSFNKLRGKIPNSLENCKSLTVFNVGYNNFDDTFPCMLPSSLRVLVLRSNRFHGELRCNNSYNWSSNLQIVDLSSNHFNGSLHGLNLSNWKGMMMTRNGTHVRPKHSASDLLSPSYYYMDEVRLTVKGLEVNLVKIWPDFTCIDLSCNNFHGGIPNDIANLTSLYLLNLSHNALTATIPKSLGALTELGSLDLSVNQLRGRIPEEVAGLTFLSILNVSYNHLVGKIPSGRQFQTFSAYWFEGNKGLCGFPLNTSCRSTSDGNHDSTPPEVEEEEEIKWEYVCAAVGYGVGLGIVAWILLFWRKFRETFFDKIEEAVENIFKRRENKRRGRRTSIEMRRR